MIGMLNTLKKTQTNLEEILSIFQPNSEDLEYYKLKSIEILTAIEYESQVIKPHVFSDENEHEWYYWSKYQKKYPSFLQMVCFIHSFIYSYLCFCVWQYVSFEI